MDIKITQASEDDAEIIMKIVNEAYDLEFEWKISDRFLNVEEVLTYMRKPNGRFYIARVVDTNEAIGCVFYLEKDRNQINERAYFGPLAVLKKVKKQGLGRKLIEFIEGIARLNGIKVMEIDVISVREGELVPLYTKFGYEKFGTAIFPGNPYLKDEWKGKVTLILLRKNL